MSPAPADRPSIGQCAQVACVWEVTARKAGNVHRFANFADLTYLDFVLSALAIAPELDLAPSRSIGETALAAVRATREVVSTNANLGIVLLLAPLAKAGQRLRDNLPRVLTESTVEDARLVYEGIRLSRPAGLGRAAKQDIADEPTQTLPEVMTLAAERDRVARQYASDFADIFEIGVPAFQHGWQQFGSVEAAIIHCQLRFLAAFPDSLIVRKRGVAEAEEATRRARTALELGSLATDKGQRAYAELDRWLRADGHARNPGTTADLVTASLFVALREGTMTVSAPFPCHLLPSVVPSESWP